MRDVFYTLLVVWIIWRVLNAFSSGKTKQQSSAPNNSTSGNYKKEGETRMEYVPPKSKPINDDAGEYVDYEEVK